MGPPSGTELVGAADRSLVALWGASPEASTAAFIAIRVLEKNFPAEITESAWLPKLKEINSSFDVSLIDDANITPGFAPRPPRPSSWKTSDRALAR